MPFVLVGLKTGKIYRYEEGVVSIIASGLQDLSKPLPAQLIFPMTKGPTKGKKKESCCKGGESQR